MAVAPRRGSSRVARSPEWRGVLRNHWDILAVVVVDRSFLAKSEDPAHRRAEAPHKASPAKRRAKAIDEDLLDLESAF
jgi:hypothetical protein